MTEEEKKAAETAAAEEAQKKADAEATEAAKKAAEDEANAQQNDIDVKAELAKERERREKAEKELAERRFKEAEAKRKEGQQHQDPDPDTDPEDKPLTAKDLQAIEERLYQKAQKDLQSQRIVDIANSLAAGDEDMAALIIETHKNRVFPADLTLEGQLEESFAIINGRKAAAKAAQLIRALKSKENASRTAPGTHHGNQMTEEPELGSAEAQALKDAGMTWDGIKRVYKKPVGKKTYYFDPKTRKRWAE